MCDTVPTSDLDAQAAGIRCILWDFGDTLVDERIMWPVPDGVPQWTDAWLALAGNGVLDRWWATCSSPISGSATTWPAGAWSFARSVERR